MTTYYYRKPIGKDRWGEFFDLSGNEAVGKCFWCGHDTKNRYCCQDHHNLYLQNFIWSYASAECGRRAAIWGRDYLPYHEEYYWFIIGYKCRDCKGIYEGEEIEIHHIIPLDGEYRNVNVLNHQKNLVLLCKDCHHLWHKEFSYLLKRYEEACKSQMELPYVLDTKKSAQII